MSYPEQNVGAFAALGRVQAKYAAIIPVVGFTIAAVLAGVGLNDMAWKTDVNDLWIKGDGRVGMELDWLARDDVDGNTRVDNELIMSAVGPDRDGDVLTPDALATHLAGAIIASSTTVEYNGEEYNMEDFCKYSFGDPYASPCTRATPLDCFKQGDWDYPAVMTAAGFNLYTSRPDFTKLDAAGIKAVVDQGCFMFDGGTQGIPQISLDNVIGGRDSVPDKNDCSKTTITKARGLQTAYVTVRDQAFVNRMAGFADEDGCSKAQTTAMRNVGETKGLPKVAPTLADAAKIRKMLNEKIETLVSQSSAKHQKDNNSDAVSGAYMSTSLAAELERQQNVNRTPLAVGYLLMVIYNMLALASWRCDCVQSRAVMGFLAVLTTILGVAGGIGLSAIFGIDMNSAAQSVLPLVLLGIGIDDVFVMAFNFAPIVSKDAGLSIEDIMADFMAEIGPSVTLTSLTNMAIFGIASLIPIPLVSDFSAMSATTMFVIWLMVLFVYPCFLALDYQRRKAGRADLLCCVKPSGTGADSQVPVDKLNSFVKEYYAPFVTSVGGMVLAVVVLVTFVAVSATHFGDVELDLQVQDVIDDDAVIRPAVEIRFMHFDTYGFDLVTRGISFDTVDMQHRMIAAHERLTNTENVVRNYYPNILVAFYGWAAPAQPGQSEAEAPGGSKVGCTFGLFEPPKDLASAIAVKNDTPEALAAAAKTAGDGTGGVTCGANDAGEAYKYSVCFPPGSATLASMRNGVNGAVLAQTLAAGMDGVMAQAGASVKDGALAEVKAGALKAALAQAGASVKDGALAEVKAGALKAALAQAGASVKDGALAEVKAGALTAALASTKVMVLAGALAEAKKEGYKGALQAVAVFGGEDFLVNMALPASVCGSVGCGVTLYKTMPADQQAALRASIGESALLANMLMKTDPTLNALTAPAAVAKLLKEQKDAMLNGFATDAIVANELVTRGEAADIDEGMAAAAVMDEDEKNNIFAAANRNALVGTVLSTDPAAGMAAAATMEAAAKKTILDRVVEAAIVGSAVNPTDPTAGMATAATMTAEQKAPILDGIAESAIVGNAVNPTDPAAGMAAAATMEAAAKKTILDGVAEAAIVGNAVNPTDPAAGMATAATMTAEQKAPIISGVAKAGVAANFLSLKKVKGTSTSPNIMAAMAEVGQMTPAQVDAEIASALVGPQWGLSDSPWCFGMQKEPLALADMADVTDPSKVVSHPHQLGSTMGFRKCFDLFLNTDPTAKGVFGGDYIQTEGGKCDASGAPRDTKYPMIITKSPMMAKNLDKGPEFVQLIKESRAILHIPDPKMIGDPKVRTTEEGDMFPSGVPFIFWEQYVTLMDELQEKLGYALLVSIAAVMLLLFLLSPAGHDQLSSRVIVAVWGSVIVNVFCVLTVVQVYGFMGVAGIKLNAIPQCTLIMTMGIAVEFTAHTVLAYICAPALEGQGYLASRQHRTCEALSRMAVPTLHGSVSTYLAIVMIATSKSKFIVLYYFVLYSFIVLFGFLNGLVVLPALLCVAGPPSAVVIAASDHSGVDGESLYRKEKQAALEMKEVEGALEGPITAAPQATV